MNFFNNASETVKPHFDPTSSSSSSSTTEKERGFSFGTRDDRFFSENANANVYIDFKADNVDDMQSSQTEVTDQHPGSFPLLRLMAGVASTVAKAALAPQTDAAEMMTNNDAYQQSQYETADDLFGSVPQDSGEQSHQYAQEQQQQQQQQTYGSSFASGFFSRVAASFLSSETEPSSSVDSSSSSSFNADPSYDATGFKDRNNEQTDFVATNQPMSAVALFSGSNEEVDMGREQYQQQHQQQHQQQLQQPVAMFKPFETMASQLPHVEQQSTTSSLNHFQPQQFQPQQQQQIPSQQAPRIFNPATQTLAPFGPPSIGVPQRSSSSAPSRSRYAQPVPVFVASDSLQKSSGSLLWG